MSTDKKTTSNKNKPCDESLTDSKTFLKPMSFNRSVVVLLTSNIILSTRQQH